MTFVVRKLESGTRWIVAHYLASPLRVYTVNEFPKSGGTWIGQLLSDALDIPFPRNTFPIFGSSVLHGHYLDPRGMKNVVVVLRDGRDVMVSWYHHCMFNREHGNSFFVDKVRHELKFRDHADVKDNMPRFIEYSFERQKYPRFNWAKFIDTWYGRNNVVFVRYEDLHRDAVEELRKTVLGLTGKTLAMERAERIVDKYSFARQAKGATGSDERGRFLRKGIVGDWRNYFSGEARSVFHHYAGDQLLRLGYEADDTWLKGDGLGC